MLPGCENHIRSEVGEGRRQGRHSLKSAVRPCRLNREVLALDPAETAKLGNEPIDGTVQRRERAQDREPSRFASLLCLGPGGAEEAHRWTEKQSGCPQSRRCVFPALVVAPA